MIIPELNEALVNLDTDDDYEQIIVYRKLYRIICRKRMLCFDKAGNANGMDGEMIIRRVIRYYTEHGRDDKCWWMRRFLLSYRKRFRGITEQPNCQPSSAEFVYLPSPAHRPTIAAEW